MNRLMRFLNRILIMACVLGTAFPAVSEDNSSRSTISNATLLFGRSFRQERTFGANTYFEYTSRNESIGLRIVKYKSNDFARVYIKDRLTLFNSVFDVKRVDYPGQYSKAITCPDEFKPKFVESEFLGGYVAYYSGFANKNKTTGACAADLLGYKYSYGFVLCFNKGALYEFEHYSELNSEAFNQFRDDIVCD